MILSTGLAGADPGAVDGGAFRASDNFTGASFESSSVSFAIESFTGACGAGEAAGALALARAASDFFVGQTTSPFLPIADFGAGPEPDAVFPALAAGVPFASLG